MLELSNRCKHNLYHPPGCMDSLNTVRQSLPSNLSCDKLPMNDCSSHREHRSQSSPSTTNSLRQRTAMDRRQDRWQCNRLRLEDLALAEASERGLCMVRSCLRRSSRIQIRKCKIRFRYKCLLWGRCDPCHPRRSRNLSLADSTHKFHLKFPRNIRSTYSDYTIHTLVHHLPSNNSKLLVLFRTRRKQKRIRLLGRRSSSRHRFLSRSCKYTGSC